MSPTRLSPNYRYKTSLEVENEHLRAKIDLLSSNIDAIKMQFSNLQTLTYSYASHLEFMTREVMRLRTESNQLELTAHSYQKFFVNLSSSDVYPKDMHNTIMTTNSGLSNESPFVPISWTATSKALQSEMVWRSHIKMFCRYIQSVLEIYFLRWRGGTFLSPIKKRVFSKSWANKTVARINIHREYKLKNKIFNSWLMSIKNSGFGCCLCLPIAEQLEMSVEEIKTQRYMLKHRKCGNCELSLLAANDDNNSMFCMDLLQLRDSLEDELRSSNRIINFDKESHQLQNIIK